MDRVTQNTFADCCNQHGVSFGITGNEFLVEAVSDFANRIRLAAIHDCANKAAELEDCSGRFIADQLRDMAFGEQNTMNENPE